MADPQQLAGRRGRDEAVDAAAVHPGPDRAMDDDGRLPPLTAPDEPLPGPPVGAVGLARS